MSKKEVTIPPGFKDLLQEYTVAVLRDYPSDIIEYSANFFDAKRNGNKENTMLASKAEDEVNNSTQEDDEMEDEAPPMAPPPARGRRRGVAAESFDPEKEDDPNKPKEFHEKTAEQRARLNLAVKDILLFRCLDDEQMQDVIDAMFERKVVDGEKVIAQGDDGDNFYVIERGHYDIEVNINGVPTKVGSYDGVGSFGELALMYNTPRAATIISRGEDGGVCWAMTRETFRSIVLKKAFQKRLLYEALLENVPLLEQLNSYERMSIADALRTRIYEPNTLIIRQGEPGHEMFFVEEGSVRVTMKSVDGDGDEKELTQLSKGQYFGELALITKHPRAASVYSMEKTKLAVLDVGSFERLLGPCLEILQRNVSAYEDKLKDVFGDNVPELRK